MRVVRAATRSAGLPSKTIWPPSWPCARAEVDDPVGVRHHRLVVLDDDDRLAGVDEPVEQGEQLLDVGQVQAGGRLVEDVDTALLAHAGGQLEPLPLAARQRRQRLAQAEIAEPDVVEPLEDGERGRDARLTLAEELQGLARRHREHLADVTAAEVILQHRGVEPLAPAHLAGGRDAGHHAQVGVDDPGTIAVGARPLGVRAEQGRLAPSWPWRTLCGWGRATRCRWPGCCAASRGWVSGQPSPPRRARTPSRGSASSYPSPLPR